VQGVRLTSLSHGGGCGCKLSPAVLEQIIAKSGGGLIPSDLLVGIETSDDAAVYRISEDQAIVATTDFFMPIVDDPFDFGRIAATNAISDVYAMGGTPIMALALVGMPIDKLPVEVIRRILDGGESICTEAMIPVAGGHTIDSVEPIYGLVVMGLVHPERIKTNRGAQRGDVLVLGKPLGVGVLSAAVKKNRIDAPGYRELIASTTKLNTPGRLLSGVPGVHAMTDVTGFGLLGHLLPMCRAANLRAEVAMDRIPLLPRVEAMAAEGFVTGASARNWSSYGGEVMLGDSITPAQKSLLTDPQTSGGLLVACVPESAEEVLAIFRSEGFDRVSIIGGFGEGPAGVTVV